MSDGKTPRGGQGPERGSGRRDRVGEALARWPSAERSAAAWEQVASQVMGAATATAGIVEGVSDEALMDPPLPATAEDMAGSGPAPSAQKGQSMSTEAVRARDRASLKELAKLADLAPASGGMPSSRPPSGAFKGASDASSDFEDNSGIIHLSGMGAAAAEPASQGSGPGPAKASSVTATASPATAAARAAMAKGPAPTPAAGAPTPGASRWRMMGGLAAAAAVAVGVFVGIRRPVPVGEAPGTVAVAPPPAAAPAAPKTQQAPVAAQDPGVDPSTLPAAGAAGGAAVAPAAGPRPAKAGGGSAATPAAPVAVAQPTPDPAPAAAPPPAKAAATGTASLEALMQQAAGVTPAAATGAAPATDSPQATQGSVPLKPSLGAIQGALGTALPAARACLGPDDPVSRATVTFQSDGSVQSVSVSGGAAGKPAEGCIRAALQRARVAPFAQPTFSAPTTIRGN